MLRRTFAEFYRRNDSLLEKHNTCLKTLVKFIFQPAFYGDFIYNIRKNERTSSLSYSFYFSNN